MTETLSQLSNEFAVFCNTNGLPHESADELVCNIGAAIHNLRQVQADAARELARLERVNAYLHTFIERWSVAGNRADLVHAFSCAGYALEICGGGALMWHLNGPRLYAVISAIHGGELQSASERCTLAIYDPADGGESLIESNYGNVHKAIAAAALLIGEY